MEEAESTTRKAIEIKPNFTLAYLNLGNILRNLGKLKEAERNTRKAIELNPLLGDAHSNLGIILKDLGLLEEAEESTRKAIEIKPGYVNAYSNLGVILKDLGKLKEAEEYTRKAIEIQPNFANAHFNLGGILKGIGELHEAEESARRAIDLNPSFGDAYYSLSSILKSLGKLEEAEKSARKAIDINQHCAKANYLLSLVLSDKGNYSEALEEIQKTIKKEQYNHIYQGELARLKYILNELDLNEKSSESPWGEEDDYYLEDNGQKTLIVFFASDGISSIDVPRFNFFNLFKEIKSFDKLYLRDLKRNYFIDGLGGTTNNFLETKNFIKEIISSKCYETVLSVGSSSGGYAAILFGNLLKFKKVVVFNPQTVLTSEKELIINDLYFGERAAKELRQKYINDNSIKNYLNLKNLIPFNTQVDIHYSKFSEVDKNYASFIEHKNCTLFEHESSSHILAYELRIKGKLKNIILSSFNLK